MDRRGFFRNALRKTSQKAVELADARAKKRARQWIRPPYAINELEFLLTCSRCGACIEACPHDVIFSLKPALGAEVAGTPAMDLVNRACQLCGDWPCVSCCEPHALMYPKTETSDEQGMPAPRLSHLSVDTSRCLPYLGPECGACEGSCPVEGALTWDMYRPVIVDDLCLGCAQCRHACVMVPSAITVSAR